MKTRYWGYRIATNEIKFFQDELAEGRLRQGWGHDGQNLRGGRDNIDRATRKNLRMLEVKKGDVVLVPRLPTWGEVAIAEATEDWHAGYRFERAPDRTGFGHIFPARCVASFARSSLPVSGALRRTLRYQGRFWNIDDLGHDVEQIRRASSETRGAALTDDALIRGLVAAVCWEYGPKIEHDVISRLHRGLEGKAWETVLAAILRERFPGAAVTHVGGPGEVATGTDVLVTVPGIVRDRDYAIAIQIKDYTGKIGAAATQRLIQQISKANTWGDDPDKKVIDRAVVLVRASEADNKDLVAEVGRATGDEVTLVFKEDLEPMLLEFAQRVISEELGQRTK